MLLSDLETVEFKSQHYWYSGVFLPEHLLFVSRDRFLASNKSLFLKRHHDMYVATKLHVNSQDMTKSAKLQSGIYDLQR